MADETKPDKAPDKPFVFTGEVTLEIDVPIKPMLDERGDPVMDDQGIQRMELTGRNGYVAFGPCKGVPLRAKWSKSYLIGDEAGSEGIKRLPQEIPGQQIWLSGQQKRAKIIDPLGKQHTGVLQQASIAMSAITKQRYKAQPDTNYDLSKNPDDMKTWLWEMFKLVRDDKARVVQGTLPKEAEIMRMEGKRRREYWNDSPRRRMYEEDAEPSYETVRR